MKTADETPDTIEGLIRTLAENSGMDLTAVDIGNRLKQQWRENHNGGCKIISQGGSCECHLCLIDKLVAMIYKEPQP